MIMNGSERLENLLKELTIRAGDVVFFHSSFNRLRYLNLSAEQILKIIINTLGENGTLVLPCYAWEKTWQGYREYFHDRPIFDIRHTPANIGYIPETFRKMPGVKRSLNYWWSICAFGKLAEEVIKDQARIVYYYGEGSSFDTLRKNKVKILGLGVSLNTTSLSPMVDYILGKDHPQKIFTKYPQKGNIIDYEGKRIETNSYWLLPEAVRLMKPSKVIEYSTKLQKALYRKDEGTTIQFTYEFNIYFEEAHRLALEAIKTGKKLPWLESYEFDEGQFI